MLQVALRNAEYSAVNRKVSTCSSDTRTTTGAARKAAGMCQGHSDVRRLRYVCAANALCEFKAEYASNIDRTSQLVVWTGVQFAPHTCQWSPQMYLYFLKAEKVTADLSAILDKLLTAKRMHVDRPSPRTQMAVQRLTEKHRLLLDQDKQL